MACPTGRGIKLLRPMHLTRALLACDDCHCKDVWTSLERAVEMGPWPLTRSEPSGAQDQAQMLGTGSLMSDYVLVTVILPLRPGDEDYAISCVVPTASGLKLYPRRPHALGLTSIFDYPLSSRLDESDSLVVFGTSSCHGRTC
jgi:4-hydroxyphenylacetate 3-hydroxylase N terminal